jgi:ubiquitin C-terminal hydrolase
MNYHSELKSWGVYVDKGEECITNYTTQELSQVRGQWLIPVILATQEAEISRITIQIQPGKIVCEILS